MYYHFAILLLFRPLIKLRIVGSSICPRDVCTQAADAIQGLLHSYSQLYTLRRTPSFVPYFVLTSSIMHLAIAASSSSASHAQGADSSTKGSEQRARAKLGDNVSAAINQGIADLTEMAPCHHFAEQALNILRYLAKKWNIEINIDDRRRLEELMKQEGKPVPDGTDIDEGGSGQKRRRMVQQDDYNTLPLTSSRNFFSPNVREQDFISTFGSAMPAPVGSDSPPVARTSDSMENPLFWPFPMQGRPMLPSGDMLTEAGFELL